MKDGQVPKKPIIFYYLIALLVIMLLNALVFPRFSSMYTQEVDYGTFVDMLNKKEVNQVEVRKEDGQIAFTSKKDDRVIFITGAMEDPKLVDRLDEAGVERYSQVVPKKASPILTFLLSWILPFGLMILLGQLLMRSMQKRMGGPNAMSFGKSNAKVYVAAETGKTFKDVAGQEEAKSALQEIVDFLHNPEKYNAIGAQMPKGALLVGPPGTGKTLLARHRRADAQGRAAGWPARHRQNAAGQGSGR